jgi:hypothetical protein
MRQSYEGPKLAPERAWLMIGYQRLSSLARDRLPLMISPDDSPSPQEDWRVIRAAFLARIARTGEALSALVPLSSRLDAMDLVRNLLEHVVCLAWIAADPDTRFPIWLKRDYQGRIKLDDAVQNRIAKGTETRWPEQPLAQGDRAYYAGYVERVQGRLPRMRDMCKQADKHWLPRYPAGLANHSRMSFVNDYDDIYDLYSWMAHPRLTGLQAFWDFRPQWTVVHADETGEHSHDPLHMGQLLGGHGLLIAAMVMGTPDVAQAIELLNSNAELARLVREGKVVTEEIAPGTFQLKLSTATSDA